MAQTDEIIVRFKAEGGEQVEEHFKRIGDASEGSTRGVKKAGDSLDGLRLKSEGRVAHNIGAIAQSFASGADAGDLFAETVTRISESFKGSLLFAGAALGGYAIYQGITRASEAALSLEAEITKITRSRGSGSFRVADDIKQQIRDADAELHKLREREVYPLKAFSERLGVFAGSGFKSESSPSAQLDEDGRRRVALNNTVNEQTRELARNIFDVAAAEKIRREFGSHFAELAGEELRYRKELAEVASLPGQDNTATHAVRANHEEIVRSLNREDRLQKQIFLRGIESAKVTRGDIDDTTRQVTLLDRQVQLARQLVRDARGGKEQLEAKLHLEQALTAQDTFIRQTQFQQKLEFDLSVATTRSLEEKARGHERLARTLEVEAGFEARIARAQHDGKNFLIPQLRRQERALLFNQNVDELLKSPGRQAADARREQREQIRRDRAEAILNDQADRQSRGAHGQSDAGTEHGKLLQELISITRKAWN